jgi:hypothetical protein
VCVANFSALPREGYRVGSPKAGRWDDVINTDAGTALRCSGCTASDAGGGGRVVQPCRDGRGLVSGRRHRAAESGPDVRLLAGWFAQLRGGDIRRPAAIMVNPQRGKLISRQR